MSMNKSDIAEAHVSSTPLVICVGDESRMWEFEENGFTAFVYKQLDVEFKYSGAPNYGGPLSPIHTRNSKSYRLDARLYKLGLEGRRVVILAPPYTGPRKDNPSDRVAGYLREEGAHVSIVPDQCVLLNKYGRFDEDAEYLQRVALMLSRACHACTTG